MGGGSERLLVSFDALLCETGLIGVNDSKFSPASRGASKSCVRA